MILRSYQDFNTLRGTWDFLSLPKTSLGLPGKSQEATTGGGEPQLGGEGAPRAQLDSQPAG